MKVLVTDRFDVEAFSLLKTAKGISVSRSATSEPTPKELEGIEALIIRSRTKITPEFLKKAATVQVIVTSTSGYDHIDLKATKERSIAVMYTPNANAASACELTWALVLAAARKIVAAHRSVKAIDWKRESLLGTQLSGKTYGIIGLGRIGSRVAKVAQAFGMKTIAHDPYLEQETFDFNGCERMSLDEVFKFADVVSCHVPASEETFHMISSGLLQEGNEGLILVNTSRGSIVEESVLVGALETGAIGALGLDVFEQEPLRKDSKLLKFENVVMSPHIGATTHEAFAAASMEAAEKILNFASNQQVFDSL